MGADEIAGLALAAAGLLAAWVVYLRRSPKGQGFSAQIGDEVVTGFYKAEGGQIHVTSDLGTRSAPLAEGAAPLRAAERLLAELHAARQH